MPPQGIKDWLSDFETIADKIGFDVIIDETGIFKIRVDGDPPTIGKIRYSEYSSRKEDHIWQRFDRELEAIKDDTDQRVFAVQLDLASRDKFDREDDHFIFLDEEFLKTKTSGNGDVHIDTEKPGQYEGHSGNIDNWNVLFEYLTREPIDQDLSAILEAQETHEPVSETAPYYWVNQNEGEIEGEFLRAPTSGRFQHDLPKLKSSDIVFSYLDGQIVGYHEVEEPARIVEIPAEEAASYSGTDETVERYRVETAFTRFDEPLEFVEVFPTLLEHKLDKYYPVNHGGINQQYLFNLSETAGRYLLRKGDAKAFGSYEDLSDAETDVHNRLDDIPEFGSPLSEDIALEKVREWKEILRRNNILEGDVRRGDYEPLAQIRRLYEAHEESLNDRAEELGVKRFKNLTPGEVLFIILLRDLQREAGVSEVALNFNQHKFSRIMNQTYISDEGIPTASSPPARAEEIRRQLTDQGQLVFHGPPGTGKTYTAKQFAHWWLHQTPDEPYAEQLRTVTFHPSFTYEDFIEGLQATESDGAVTYNVEPGVFKDFVDLATKAHENVSDDEEARPYLLIIDEINRGNLAQIFGETITLLEQDKRLGSDNETTVQLPHSGDEFVIPPNLYIIGTMNTADRSIALVDAALRRRFRFLHFPPAMATLEETYEFSGEVKLESLATSGDPADSLLALSILAWDRLNARIREATQLGRGKQIGHSYLLGIDREENTTEQIDQIVDIWQFEILPLLEEYYFGQFVEIERQLFDGDTGELLDIDRQEIRDFTAGELATVLSDLVGLDVEWTPPSTSRGSFSNSLTYLADQGILQVGDELQFDTDAMHENPDLKHEPDSDYWSCTIADLSAQKSVRWAHDGELHSLTDLARRIDHDHRDTNRPNYAGPDYWSIPGLEEYSLLELSRGIQNNELSSDELRSKVQ